MAPLAAAGYHVLAPDMRGYGGTDAPADVAAYDIEHLVADMASIVDEAGRERAVIVGHDWGAVVAWHAALLRPDRFRAVAALSVPHFGRPPAPPLTIWKQRYGDNFYYILYHQAPGVAEREYDADPEGLLRMLYASPDSPREPPSITSPHHGAGGFIGRWGRPRELPAWLTAEDLEYYVAEFRRAGFRGGLNYYRNFDRNWQLLQAQHPVVAVPALFIAGERDPVVAHLGRDEVERRMRPLVPDLRHIEWIEGAGHWIQQERPAACNRALLAFLAGL
jgi:pimeloyl-ACP methyl ester carboxylesterase